MVEHNTAIGRRGFISGTLSTWRLANGGSPAAGTGRALQRRDKPSSAARAVPPLRHLPSHKPRIPPRSQPHASGNRQEAAQRLLLIVVETTKAEGAEQRPEQSRRAAAKRLHPPDVHPNHTAVSCTVITIIIITITITITITAPITATITFAIMTDHCYCRSYDRTSWSRLLNF